MMLLKLDSTKFSVIVFILTFIQRIELGSSVGNFVTVAVVCGGFKVFECENSK